MERIFPFYSPNIDSIVLNNSGGAAHFIAKYNNAGTAIWAQPIGGGTDDGSGMVAVDAAGNSYFTGWFSGTAAFGNTNLTSQGLDDFFAAKFDTAGNLLWLKQAGGTNYDRGYGIAVDSFGNSYAAGFFASTCTFDSFTLTSAGGFDSFASKIDGPSLTITRLPNQVVIAWPTNAAGLGLQVATNLASSVSWLNSTNKPAVVGEQNTVTNNLSSGSRFYRLKNL